MPNSLNPAARSFPAAGMKNIAYSSGPGLAALLLALGTCCGCAAIATDKHYRPRVVDPGEGLRLSSSSQFGGLGLAGSRVRLAGSAPVLVIEDESSRLEVSSELTGSSTYLAGPILPILPAFGSARLVQEPVVGVVIHFEKLEAPLVTSPKDWPIRVGEEVVFPDRWTGDRALARFESGRVPLLEGDSVLRLIYPLSPDDVEEFTLAMPALPSGRELEITFRRASTTYYHFIGY